MNLRAASIALATMVALGGALWVGCGDDDDDGVQSSALFFGDVASVTGGSASLDRTRPNSFARFLPFPRLAWAQSTCAAPSGGNLLFCVDQTCGLVDPADCDFRETVPLDGPGPVRVVIRFVDDEDEDGDADGGESEAVVQQNLDVCDGDEIEVADAAIDFDGIGSATIRKVVDNCDGTTPTPTRTSGTPRPTGSPRATVTPGGPTPTRTRTATPGGPTPTRTRTPTPGGPTATPGGPTVTPGGPTVTPGGPTVTPGGGGATATPTLAAGSPTPTGTRTPTGTATQPYGYGVAMNDAPAIPFAFLASLGVIGLLVPRRRR